MLNNLIKPIFLFCLILMIGVAFFPSVSKAKNSTLPAPEKVRARSNQQERIKLTWKE